MEVYIYLQQYFKDDETYLQDGLANSTLQSLTLPPFGTLIPRGPDPTRTYTKPFKLSLWVYNL